MAIYLVQHGEAQSKDLDPTRPLSELGRSETQRIAEVARGYGVPVARIEHSGKLRAEQTAAIMAEQLAPAGGVGQRAGLSPRDDVAPVASELDPASGLMLVGHLPFMQRLMSQLVVGDPGRRLFRFQPGGIACLDRDDDGWYIRWTLMPRIG